MDPPPADEPMDPPTDEPAPMDPPPADEPMDPPPADEPMDPSDEPPADAPPVDEIPGDAPPADAPPAEGSGDAPFPFPAPAPEDEDGPASRPTSETPDEHAAEHSHAPAEVHYYPAEEEEFGPIDVNYRGPVELSVFGGWRVYSDELDVESGGAFIGGARLTLNLFENHRLGLDFSYSVTRINFNVDGTTSLNNVTRRTKTRGEVTINSFLVGATHRMDYLRLEYLTPFIRAGLGVNYFDKTTGHGQSFSAIGTAPLPFQEKIKAEFGLLVQLGIGFDYKLDRNWSFRLGTNVDAMINDWADRDSPQFAGNLEMGVVWHFQ